MNSSFEFYERRAVAYLIDLIIAFFVATSLNTFISSYYSTFNWLTFFNLLFILPFVFYAIINTFLLYLCKGKTLGGLILRLRIVTVEENSKRLTFKQCILRSITLSVYVIVIVNFFYIIVKKNTTSIFDIASGTKVIGG